MSSPNSPLPGAPSPTSGNTNRTPSATAPATTTESTTSPGHSASPTLHRPRRNAIVEAMMEPNGTERLLARLPIPTPSQTRDIILEIQHLRAQTLAVQAQEEAMQEQEEAMQEQEEAMQAQMRAMQEEEREIEARWRTMREEQERRLLAAEEWPGQNYPRGPYLGLRAGEIEWHRDPEISERIGGINVSGEIEQPRQQIQPWERAAGPRCNLRTRNGHVRRRERPGFPPGGFGESDEEEDASVDGGVPLSFEGGVLLQRVGWRLFLDPQGARVDVVAGQVAVMMREEMEEYYGRF